jgi:hypothetical protein
MYWAPPHCNCCYAVIIWAFDARRVIHDMTMFPSLQYHLSPNAKFNFQQYIKRSLEDDFKVVVGIRYACLFGTLLFQITSRFDFFLVITQSSLYV